MKRIKVVYRATFRQPKGALNKLGVRVACPVGVEARQIGDAWTACRPDARTLTVFEEIPRQPSFASLRGSVEQLFEERLSDWKMCSPDGSELVQTSLRITDAGVFELEPEDYTHIQRPGAASSNRKLAVAMCGREFKHQAFASTLEHSAPPTCEACAQLLEAVREAR